MKYKCLINERFQFGQFSFGPIEKSHLYDIMDWRNKQLNILRTKKIHTKEDQDRYFDNVIIPSMDMDEPTSILFSFFKENVLIGYGGLTNIDWSVKKAEISFLLNNELAKETTEYLEIFTMFLKMLKNIAFKEVKLHRLFTETYDLRPIHVQALEREMNLEGRLKDHIFQDGKYVDVLFHGILNEV
ncbi:ribosomal-protein-serine acetyltransferase [Bacteriovorax stolpii]|uniref:GNAT family N-acetyltransferase n=1 Tax=Bacteriovorax stolpii TaxID=960 RepID=UPI001156F956|nr:GNAT family N-acetyltransferase [Bacteriovorax stolpii]QDK43249.1 ribosomal-protein-serine acetyltransferase [Bacteriovorax stolpii]